VQTASDTIAVLAGHLEPARSPRTNLPAFFAPEFHFGTDCPWLVDGTGTSLEVLDRDAWRRRWSGGIPGSDLLLTWGKPDEARFSRAFQSLMAELARGTMMKGVPATVMTAQMPESEAPALFSRLMARVPDIPPGLLAYGLYTPPRLNKGPEFMIGATPELLFDLMDSHDLSTAAVAGTKLSSSGPDCLSASRKDQVEHRGVVEDIVKQLTEWGVVQCSPAEVRAFEELEHLVTEVRLKARIQLDFDLVARRLHPTAALGVYPRNGEGARWLRDMDPCGERRRFGAPFGLRLPSGLGRCLVAIRNLQYKEGRLQIWAGCGVVPESRYEEEWQELLDKMQAVRNQWKV
jgi:menaquinone-specific isochorismate synthase